MNPVALIFLYAFASAEPSGAGAPPTGEVRRPARIVVGRYVAPDGALRQSAAIELSKGKITAVVESPDAAVSAGAARFPDAVACPGLIDLRSALGAAGNLEESAFAVDPGASAIDALNRGHRDFQVALRAGITAAVLLPTEKNLVAGAAAVVKTAAIEGDGVLRSDGPLLLSLSSRVWQYGRAPTSRIGSMAMLRDALETAKSGRGHERLRALVGGTLDALVVCDEPADVSGALRLLSAYGARAAILHTGETQEVMEDFRAAKPILVAGPYDLQTPARVLSAAGAVSGAGVPVAFARDGPRHNAAALRMTASLAVRYGMDPAAARRALTATAAEAAGVADRIGAIAPGRDADLVIFSDDPLRPDARVLAVYVDGVQVYAADAKSEVAGGDAP